MVLRQKIYGISFFFIFFSDGDVMSDRKTEDFSVLFEDLISSITDPENFDRNRIEQIVANICEKFRIARSTAEFYKSVTHEKRGDGEIITGYDNGQGQKIVHKRRIITKSSAVIQGTLYMREEDDPPEGDLCFPR